MRKLVISAALFLSVGICVSSCLKNDNNGPSCQSATVTTTAPDSQVARLQTYIDTNDIDAIKDSRGFFYKMDSAVVRPDSAHATNCSYVAIDYKGSFLDGRVFDSSTQTVSFPLYQLITGWQEAVPLMKRNATMTLYLPPYLAYGAAANGSIPGNSYLVFKIKLYDFSL